MIMILPNQEHGVSFHVCVLFSFFHQCLKVFRIQVFRFPQFSRSVVSNSLRPHELQHSRPPCPTNPQSLPKPMSIEFMMPSNHLMLCCPLLLLPSISPSIRVFSNESVLHIRWPKYWGFSFNISPSNEHPGLMSFRMDWLDLLAVQGILKSLLHTIVEKHQFFSTQLSL